MLEQKSKYRNKFIRTVNARQATVYDRIKEIKEVGGLHSIHIMDAQHVKLMTRLAQKAQPHPKINNIWSIQPRRNHRMNHLSCLTRRRRKSTASQRRRVMERPPEDYQCQKFALEFIYYPSRILRMI